MEIKCDTSNPPLGGLLTANYLNSIEKSVTITWGKETVLKINGEVVNCGDFGNDLIICRALARYFSKHNLYGCTILDKTQIDSWLSFTLGVVSTSAEFLETITHLNKALGPITYLVAKKLTIADFAVFASLYTNANFKKLLSSNTVPVNVLRWYNQLLALPCTKESLQLLPEEAKNSLSVMQTSRRRSLSGSRRTSTNKNNTGDNNKGAKQDGKFVDLPGAEMGKVVVRFPPEASGYLHIGHAKAALLNQYYQQAFQGKLIMRFDDTNPAKETVEFENVILEDVEMLQIKPDQFTHTSNYFDLMLEYCEKLIKEGKAYVDDTEPEIMKQEREQRKESVNRNNDVNKNMSMWQEMLKGSELGQKYCVRAKIDMSSANGCLRDPTIYRCKNEPHPRTGTKYKVYPTYDFACPIVDAIEGVTHTLRTMEYHDRDDQFYWFIEALGLRRPYIWEYSRLSMTNTVLSKRKLTWFVQEGLVDGWDDPRMPTVRGVLRRGMTVEALKQFIISQGSSRSVVFMEWDKIWSINKKIIDPIAPRYTALEFDNPVVVNVEGAKLEALSIPKHPKNDVGNKTVWVGPRILIDLADAEQLKEGENATFINWGNLKIKRINRQNGKVSSIDAVTNLDDKDYKKTLKLTWLCDTDKGPFTPSYCVHFDHIISKPLLGKDEDFKQYVGHNTRTEIKMLGDPELKSLKEGDIIQLQRRGFYRVDVPYAPVSPFSCKEQPIILFSIPDGSSKESLPASKQASTTQTKATNASKSGGDAKESKSSDNNKSAEKVNADITNQGDIVRKLKADKAPKADIDAAVKTLLALKAEFKTITGIDWKPGCEVPKSVPSGDNKSAENVSSGANKSAEKVNADIVNQGDVVRKLKSDKAPKADVDAAVKILLALKAEFKTLTGIEWKPGCSVPKSENLPTSLSANDKSAESINSKITTQGDIVRKLKADKAPKADIDAAVKILLSLKADFKNVTGKDWKPDSVVSPPKQVQTAEPKTVVKVESNEISNNSNVDLNTAITNQGDIVRKLKADKAPKADIESAVKILLSLKADFKSKTGTEWKPGSVVKSETNVPVKEEPKSPPKMTGENSQAENVNTAIKKQGDLVRQLKADKAPKPDIDEAVKVLLALKADFKQLTGIDWKPGCTIPSVKNEKTEVKTPPKQKQPKKSEVKVESKDDASGVKKQTRLGLETKKSENLSEWYSQVITKGELIEYYDVSGCYIYRPWSFAIWEHIRDWFDIEIKKLGVENCYFPIFVSRSVLEKEKTHIADFAPEVAWVTKSGDSTMAEPIAVRPTSETVMYPAYAKWIQSYRDLPLKLNQWNNVVRWEFKHPQPFIRTREFLWQEGHTAYAKKEDAEKEVMQILDLYAKIYTDLLAVPVVKGRKTEKEKFAGGDYTTTVEAFISASGRAVQGGTSHHLGQNFSKMFDIIFEDPDTQEKKYVYQNSWGITTRTIGVMIMIHADDQGLVLPPRIASIQVVIVPCGVTVSLGAKEREELYASCQALEDDLKAEGVRVKGDYRDNYSPGWKFNHWELKGVPIRIELGPKDLKNKQLVAVRRDTGEKITIPRSSAVKDLIALRDNIQNNLYTRAENDLRSHTITTHNWPEFCTALDNKNILLSPFCGEIECEDKIKADSTREESLEPGAPAMGAKSLCIPFEQPETIKSTDKCIHPDCKNKPKYYTLFGRSY
ncbi:bifunctional glutamate/proline--tRNA ligase isoform X2 [Chrysoperla carnea]|uniref:bifunctional glutamate/proline--tRNA ligase isoform X2 n=1 Tax=Chrysoperla carnea TaxID=189513 RepID=UPI001D07CCF8|nr:bifunctional glutamate/proline--tRNA ligase isoform X2 [Chrysoperla carnea]